MTRLTERQVAVLRRARERSGPASTTRLAPTHLTVAQTATVCRQLEPKGYMVREHHYDRAWSITDSGIQWLRSLDAGRPWMVKGCGR